MFWVSLLTASRTYDPLYPGSNRVPLYRRWKPPTDQESNGILRDGKKGCATYGEDGTDGLPTRDLLDVDKEEDPGEVVHVGRARPQDGGDRCDRKDLEDVHLKCTAGASMGSVGSDTLRTSDSMGKEKKTWKTFASKVRSVLVMGRGACDIWRTSDSMGRTRCDPIVANGWVA